MPHHPCILGNAIRGMPNFIMPHHPCNLGNAIRGMPNFLATFQNPASCLRAIESPSITLFLTIPAPSIILCLTISPLLPPCTIYSVHQIVYKKVATTASIREFFSQMQQDVQQGGVIQHIFFDFENLHIFSDQVYFQEFNSKKLKSIIWSRTPPVI